MTCPPVVPIKQLDGSQFQDVNCGPTCAAMAIDHASCGKVKTTPSAMRAKGRMGTGATGFDNLKAGIAAYAPEFAAQGLQAPNLIRLGYIDLPTLRSTLVRGDAYHIIAVDYEVVVDYADKQYRGDTYRGNHFVSMTRLYRKNPDGSFSVIRPKRLAGMGQKALDALFTEVRDPLADGRHSSHLHGKAPMAPQKWPLSMLFAAGDKFADAGDQDGLAPVAVIFRAPEAA